MPVTDQPVPDLPPIVDTHQHLWDLRRLTLPWHDVEDVPTLRRTFLMEDYLRAVEGLNVVKTVYMEVDVAPEQRAAEADYVLDLCTRPDNPMCGAVISARPGTSEFEPYIRRYAANSFVKGVRQVLHVPSTPPGFCLNPAFVDSIRLLGHLGLSFDLCMRPGELHDAVRLVDGCPETRFIVDHCGNMSVTCGDADLRARWQSGLQELAARPNVVCKISGIVVTARLDWTPADLAPNMNFTIDAFGEDRILFAGDWPVCTLRTTLARWISALNAITADRSITFRRKLFHDNAVKFYKL
jgi:L-fuconolactonase